MRSSRPVPGRPFASRSSGTPTPVTSMWASSTSSAPDPAICSQSGRGTQCRCAAARLYRLQNRLKPPRSFSRFQGHGGMNILPGNLRFGAGQPVKRLEDQRLLTGKGQFIDDKPEEGGLWLHVRRSPPAHAKIISIDTKAARAMAAVETVFTGADLIADDIGPIPPLSVFMRPDGKPMTVPPRRLLAHE